MAGEHDKLRETLDRLRGQLGELRQRDRAVADQLEATIDEVRQSLEGRLAKGASDSESILQRLSDLVLQYEASHPSLAANLGSVIDALGRMGI